MQPPQAATKRSGAMPRQRRWESNHRLVHEREQRGWSQEDAAREAEKVADRLGQPDLVFTGGAVRPLGAGRVPTAAAASSRSV
jgi:hypothetical protein